MSEELPPSDADGPEPVDPVDEVRAADADAWATACAEDLAEEKARRRERNGQPPGSAAEELRKFVDAVADRLSTLQSPLLGAVAGPAAQQVVKQVVDQAKAAVEPVIERNPDVFDHLAAAGTELLAAYRSAVQNQERRWTAGDGGGQAPKDGPDRGDDAGPGERIDLD
ncbi:DUF5304 domain-containing protein [Streptomyces sp. NPDC059374]|uniref:DUF5304 domain-containing protein n=1 Tax=unclassified Streptomyces TaxID=2593676 RepID=UPI00364E72E0